MLSSSLKNLKAFFSKEKFEIKTFFQSKRLISIAGAFLFFMIFLTSLFFSPHLKTATIREKKLSSSSDQSALVFEKDFHEDIEDHLQLQVLKKDQHVKLLQSEIHEQVQKYDKLEQDLFTLNSQLEQLHERMEDQNHNQKKISQLLQDQSFDIDLLLDHQKNHFAQTKDHTSRENLSAPSSKFILSVLKDNPVASVKNYIPAGTFVSAKLLGGIDVSTNPGAQKNPQPLLLHLTDLAQLPSLGQYDIRHCRVTAQAWGDLSAERAYARTDRLSCVLANGEIIDTPIQAFLVDDTGKNGIRGDVVARNEGEMITQAFLSKFISALGGAADSLAQSHLIKQENLSWADASKNSLINTTGKGLNSVGDTLEEYFISRLNELSPVIQILADKRVDIVFTQGVELQPIYLPSMGATL